MHRSRGSGRTTLIPPLFLFTTASVSCFRVLLQRLGTYLYVKTSWLHHDESRVYDCTTPMHFLGSIVDSLSSTPNTQHGTLHASRLRARSSLYTSKNTPAGRTTQEAPFSAPEPQYLSCIEEVNVSLDGESPMYSTMLILQQCVREC